MYKSATQRMLNSSNVAGCQKIFFEFIIATQSILAP